MGWLPREEISKDVEGLDTTIGQQPDGISRTFHPQWQTTDFSRDGAFVKMEHILGLRSDLSTFKTTELMKNVFSDHSKVKQGTHSRKTTGGPPDWWKWDNILPSNTWVKEILKEIKMIEMDGNKNTAYQNMWDAGNAVLRGKFIALKLYIKNEDWSQK